MKTTIWIEPLSLIPIEDLNNILENTLEAKGTKGIPSDIGYKLKKLNKDGTISIEATFQLENL